MKYGEAISPKEEYTIEYLKKHGISKTLEEVGIKIETLRNYRKRYNKYMENIGRPEMCYREKLAKTTILKEKEEEAEKQEEEPIGNKTTWSENRSIGRASLSFVTAKLPTNQEEIAKEYNVDLSVWEPDKMKTNTWQMTNREGEQYNNHQVYVTYKIRKNLNFREVFDKLFEKYTDKLYEYKELSEIRKANSKCAILNLYDAHIDKISIKAETGEDSDLESNIRRFKAAFDSLLLGIIKEDPELIIFPIGNDLYHTNNFNGTTKHGMSLQYYTSPEDSYAAISNIAVESILKLLEHTNAKIQIYFLAGNHDCDNITILSYWLNRMFKDHSRVMLGDNRRKRKYHRYGDNLFMFAHGDKEKKKIAELPLFMAEESGIDFAECKNKKIYLGDIHHEQEFKFLKTKDRPGVEVSFLRSIGCSDKYHHDNGWIGIPKSAYAEIWAKDGSENITRRINF